MNVLTPNHLLGRVRRLFGKASLRLQVAALPWRKADDGVEIMLITSRDTGRWVLPKGWPESGENLFDAAAREAGEEAGLSGSVSRREIGRYYYAKALSSGKEVPCEVLVYPFLLPNYHPFKIVSSAFGPPQRPHGALAAFTPHTVRSR